ncbi:MAG: hypothetical protein ABI613_01630 [Gemmatimonadota bacterium]
MSSPRLLTPRTGLLLVILSLLPACGTRTQERRLVAPELATTLDHQSPWLKVHMRNGDLYVLSQWRSDSISGTVTGNGQHLDQNRVVQTDGSQQVAMDSVALLETNVLHRSPGIAAMAVLTGISAAVTVVCLADTKACFGSCPTFYVSDGERPMLQAEGFSGSIAPALEARDIDALYRARPQSRTLEVNLKNEALETHVIRYARILAVPRPAEGRVFATGDGRFLTASRLTSPAVCRADEGDCLADVAAFDARERSSTADSTDLATRETIDLEFPNSPEHPGLVIASRQSLLTTYLLYQTFAYLGTRATEALSMLERADRPHGPAMLDVLGGIEVMVDSAGQWVTVGNDFEVGPLATDVRVVPLSHSGRGGVIRVRLRLTKGNWRLDYLALADLDREVMPIRLDPFEVLRGDAPDTVARQLLVDTASTLVTLPGDAFTLRYRLPEHPERYELFLESRGYYLEWMREEWLKEENPERSAIALGDPARALRMLAPEYKKLEPRMDAAFWRSRYAKP